MAKKMTTANARCDAALEYVAAGLPVFPCEPGTKKPLTKWQAEATTDPAIIRGWWKRWPDAVPAAPSGKNLGIVLDLDVKNGVDGVAEWGRICARHGKVDAPTRLDGGEGLGRQLFFACPAGVRIKNLAGQIAKGIDVRGCKADGSPAGYTILPPGNGKRWRSPEDREAVLKHRLPPIPDWLLFLMIFNQRDRETYSKLGIAGHEAFADLPPGQWEAEVDRRFKAHQLKALPPKELKRAFTASGDLTKAGAERLRRYLEKGIAGELSALAAALPGTQEQTANNAALKIHGLLLGAEVLGAPVADLRTSMRGDFIRAVVGLPPGRPTEPWTEEQAAAKWERGEAYASPRDLAHVAAGLKSSADHFTDVPEAASPPRRAIKWPVIGRAKRPEPGVHENLEALLAHEGIEVRQNVFANCTEVRQRGGDFAPLSDITLAHLRSTAHASGLYAGKEELLNGVHAIGSKVAHHPVREHLKGLAWDRVSRLDTWLPRLCKAEDTPLNRATGAIILIAAVNRVFHPGCKLDTVPVLESAQGTGKSSLVRALALRDEWFGDGLKLGEAAREVIEQTAGKWIIEIPELDGLSKRETSAVKAQITQQTDRARAAYGRLPIDVPRGWILIGTVNEKRYLKDRTGNRRFLPVAVGQIDLEGLRQELPQLYAEARARAERGESHVLPPELQSAASAAQAQRREEEPIEQFVEEHLADRVGWIKTADLQKVLQDRGMTGHRLSAADWNRVTDALAAIRFTRKQRRIGGQKPWGYENAPGPRLVWCPATLSFVPEPTPSNMGGMSPWPPHLEREVVAVQRC